MGQNQDKKLMMRDSGGQKSNTQLTDARVFLNYMMICNEVGQGSFSAFNCLLLFKKSPGVEFHFKPNYLPYLNFENLYISFILH